MKTFIKFLIALVALAFFTHSQKLCAQQWQGVSTATGNIYRTGNIGIGTTNPGARVEIRGTSDINSLFIRQDKNNGGVGDVFYLRDDRGYEGNNNGTTFKIESWRGYGQQGGTLLNFVTIDNGFHKSRLFINNDNGNVGIGTTLPDSRLTVKGNIHAEEVKVDLNVPGPDYVFENDYPLLTLTQVESFIQQNKHLPEVPSATQMEQEGINLGEMNMLLLKKVEELTLYMIELKKVVNEQQKRINELEKVE